MHRIPRPPALKDAGPIEAAMDAMPERVLIADAIIDADGDCCTIGVVVKARGIDASMIDYEDAHQVGDAVGIAHQLAAEIEYENDEGWRVRAESPAQRWVRMRAWVASQIMSDVDLTREETASRR